MYVKKRMSLLLFAALAMVLFTACGRWDFSREAAKAANEAQGANPVVTFDTSRALTDALRDAAAENVQPADIEAALKADDTLAELLAGRSVLDVRFAAGDQSADDAAAAIAAQFGRLTGRKPEAFIAMVKADNGYFYAAIVSYRTGSSSSASDGNGGTTPAPGLDPDEGEDDDPVVTKKYTITVTCDENGKVMYDGQSVSGKKVEIEVGTSGTFTFVPDATYEVDTVKVDGNEIEVSGDGYTFDDGEDHTINVTFKKCAIKSLTVEGPDKTEYWVDYHHNTGETFDTTGLKVMATYTDDNQEDVTEQCTLTMGDAKLTHGRPFTNAEAIGNQTITITHPECAESESITIKVYEMYLMAGVSVHISKSELNSFTPVGQTLHIYNFTNSSSFTHTIEQSELDNEELTFEPVAHDKGEYRCYIQYRTLNGFLRIDVD